MCTTVHWCVRPDLVIQRCQESGSRVVFGKNKHNNPPPIKRAATMNVGAGQYMSKSWAITMFPMIPPRRAATMEIAIPVARRCVGNTSVIRQSKAAFPQLITPLNIAETIKLWCLLYTKYNPIEHRPDENVLNTKKNLRPRRSIPKTARMFAGMADATVIRDSIKTEAPILSEQKFSSLWEPFWTT